MTTRRILFLALMALATPALAQWIITGIPGIDNGGKYDSDEEIEYSGDEELLADEYDQGEVGNDENAKDDSVVQERVEQFWEAKKLKQEWLEQQ